MRIARNRPAMVVVGMVVVWLTAGAVRAEIDVAAIRGSLLLAEEPAGAVSIAEAKAKLTAAPSRW